MFSKFYVTGATGFLGLTLVKKLAEANCKVSALVLPNDPQAYLLPQSIDFFIGDITDQSLVCGWLNDADENSCVIHCAGIVSVATKHSDLMDAVNIDGTANIIKACLKHNVGKLIYISSVHAMPPLKKGCIQREINVFNPKHVKGQYAKTKAIATNMVLEATRQGLNATVLQPSGLIGPGDHNRGCFTRMLDSYINDLMPAGVKGSYNFVDVRDVANGVISAVENGKPGQCYILSGHLRDIKHILMTAQEASEKSKIPSCVPLWVAKIVAPIYERGSLKKNETPYFTKYSIDVLCSNGLFCNHKAMDELSFKSRPMEVTINDTIKWIKGSKKHEV